MTNIINATHIGTGDDDNNLFPIAIPDPNDATNPLARVANKAEFSALLVRYLESLAMSGRLSYLNLQDQLSGAQIEGLLAALTGDNRLSYNSLKDILTGAGVKALLEALTGTNRLSASAINGIPTGIGYHTWTNPTITEVDTGFTIDQWVGRAFEINDGIKFDAKCRIQGGTNDWTTTSFRVSLPVASSSPSGVIGTITGYGGSNTKFFRTFVDDEVFIGTITGGVLSATYDGTTVYTGTTVGRVNTVNVTARTATLYADYGNQTWRGIAYHNGTLYAVSTTTGDHRLYSLDSSTTATPIGSDLGDDFYALTSHNGQLWAYNDTDDWLGTFNTSTGAFTQRISYGNRIASLFEANEQLYAVVDTAGNRGIYLVDTNLGSLTEVSMLDRVYTASVLINRTLYLFNSSNQIYTINLNAGPLASVNFEGSGGFVTSVGQCTLQSNLIEVQVEKMQMGDGDAFINISGSYEK